MLAAMADRLLLYGVTGYTGGLIARLAVERGMNPIAAGRDGAKVSAFAAPLGLSSRSFGLGGAKNPEAIDRCLDDVAVVLNTAGPLAATAPALVEACLRTGTHYLDLAGEVPQFEAMESLDERAREADVMLLPGAGFGVVPTDCLAAQLKKRLPAATRLRLAFEAVGGVSQGTLTTLFKDIRHAGVHRRASVLVPVEPAAEVLRLDLGDGPRIAVTNPWRGDLVTAWHSTGIPNIDTYTVFPPPVRWMMRSAVAGWLLDRRAGKTVLDGLIRRLPPGPTEKQLQAGWTRIWGEVEDSAGQRVEARMSGPEAYLFTAETALRLAAKALEGDAPAGFQTPVTAYGMDVVRGIPGVVITFS
jgi:short subunit dehydrogenase-like uncharacterized protein